MWLRCFYAMVSRLRELGVFQYIPLVQTVLIHILAAENVAKLPAYKLDPRILGLQMTNFGQISTTDKWWVTSFVYLGSSIYYSLRMLYVFGFDGDLMIVIVVHIMSFFLHLGLSYDEEMRLRTLFQT